MLLDETLFDQFPVASRSERFRHERFRMHVSVADFQILRAEFGGFRSSRVAVGFRIRKLWLGSLHALSRVPVHLVKLNVNDFRLKARVFLGRSAAHYDREFTQNLKPEIEITVARQTMLNPGGNNENT